MYSSAESVVSHIVMIDGGMDNRGNYGGINPPEGAKHHVEHHGH